MTESFGPFISTCSLLSGTPRTCVLSILYSSSPYLSLAEHWPSLSGEKEATNNLPSDVLRTASGEEECERVRGDREEGKGGGGEKGEERGESVNRGRRESREPKEGVGETNIG
eukprot:615916-Hanusia_phi.AAC.1